MLNNRINTAVPVYTLKILVHFKLPATKRYLAALTGVTDRNLCDLVCKVWICSAGGRSALNYSGYQAEEVTLPQPTAQLWL